MAQAARNASARGRSAERRLAFCAAVDDLIADERIADALVETVVNNPVAREVTITIDAACRPRADDGPLRLAGDRDREQQR